MATDNFTDVWAKLKDLHEQEVRGLYTKLTEINMERCLDAQRLDELFSKNHQLREQHKIMNDNVKVLENRLRAGLCDRCTVTQELARKKHQEFETSQLQSLQHISVLTHEISGLKEEKELLHQELRKLKYFLQQSHSTSRGNRSLSDNSISFDSSLNHRRKQSLDAVHNPMSEHQRHKHNFRLPSQESFTNPKRPFHNLPDLSMFDWHPQRISNQLHGTIALVQSSSTPCCTSEKDVTSAEFGMKLQEQRHYEEAHNWSKGYRRSQSAAEQSNTIHKIQTEESQNGRCKNSEGNANGSGEKPLDLSDYCKNKDSSTHGSESSIQFESKKAKLEEPLLKKCTHDGLVSDTSQDNMHSYEPVGKTMSGEAPSRDKDKAQEVLSPKDELKMSDNEDKVYKNLNIKAQYDSTSRSRDPDDNRRIRMKLCTKRLKCRDDGSPTVEVHLQFLNGKSDSPALSQCEVTDFQEIYEKQRIKPENEKQQAENSAAQPRKKKKKKPQDYWTSAAYKRGRRIKKCKSTQPSHTHASQCNPNISEDKASSVPDLAPESQS